MKEQVNRSCLWTTTKRKSGRAVKWPRSKNLSWDPARSPEAFATIPMIPTTRTKSESGTCKKFGRYGLLDVSGAIFLPDRRRTPIYRWPAVVLWLASRADGGNHDPPIVAWISATVPPRTNGGSTILTWCACSPHCRLPSSMRLRVSLPPNSLLMFCGTDFASFPASRYSSL
jgi:hypothetical protein